MDTQPNPNPEQHSATTTNTITDTTPPFNVVLPRPPLLIGRDLLLNDLHAHVRNHRGDQGAAVLCGPAGIGKTRVAVEYAYRFAADYPGGVYYLNARRDWSYGLARIAEQRGLNPIRRATAPLEHDRWLAIALQRYLADDLKEPLLLILDNIIDPRQITDREIGQGLHVSDLKAHLITITETMDIPEPFVPFHVPPLGSEYIQKIIGTDASAMQEMVGGFPQSAYLLRTALALAPSLQASALRHYMEGRDPVTAMLSWHHDRLPEDALLLWKLLAAFRRESVVPVERLRMMTELNADHITAAIEHLHSAGLVEQLTTGELELHARVRRYIRGRIQTYRAPLPGAVRRYGGALHNPARVDAYSRARGSRNLLIDTREVVIAAMDGGRAPDDLKAFARVLEWEVPYLRDWTQDDLRLIQQIRERAHHQQLDKLRDAYDAWLAHYPHFRTENAWRYPLNPALMNTYWGHEAAITDVATVDQRHVLTASRDGTARLWDIFAGQTLRQYKGHEAGLNCIAVLDERRFVTGAEDCTVRVFDLQNGTNLATFSGHQWAVRAVFPIDRERIISASDDNTLRLWHIPTGSEVRVFEEHSQPVADVLVWDSRTLLSAGQDGYVYRWNMLTGDTEHRYDADGHAVLALARIDRVYFAAGLGNGDIVIWHIETGDRKHVLSGHGNGVLDLLMLDKGLLLSASADALIKVWNPQMGLAVRDLRGHAGGVLGLAQTDTQEIVSVAADRTLRQWDILADQPPVQTRPLHNDWTTAIIPMRGDDILTGGADHCLFILDSRTGQPRQRINGHEDGISALLYLDEHRFLSASADGLMRIWATENGKLLRVLEGHTNEIIGVIRIDTLHVLSLSADDSLRVWDLRNGKEKRKIPAATTRPTALVAVNERAFVTTGSDNVVRLWSLDRGEPVREFSGHTGMIRHASLLGQTRILTASNDNTVRMWSLITGTERVMEGHNDYVTAVVGINDNDVVSCSFDRTLRLWDSATGQQRARLHLEEPLLTLSHLGGGRVAVGDLAGKVRVVQVHTAPSN